MRQARGTGLQPRSHHRGQVRDLRPNPCWMNNSNEARSSDRLPGEPAGCNVGINHHARADRSRRVNRVRSWRGAKLSSLTEFKSAVTYRVIRARRRWSCCTRWESGPPARQGSSRGSHRCSGRTRALPERPEGALPFGWAVIPTTVEQVNDPTRRWWRHLPDIGAPSLLIGGGPTSHIPQDLLVEVSQLAPDLHLDHEPAVHMGDHQTNNTSVSVLSTLGPARQPERERHLT